MDTIVLRDATVADLEVVTGMIRHMVTDMASYGGYPVATDEAAWTQIKTYVEGDLRDARHRCIIATSHDEIVGTARAELLGIGGSFAPLTSLHISVMYVVPVHRRSGIAASMFETLLEWGRENGASQCDLNVLAKNPARSLYEKYGLSDFQITMVKKL